MNQNSMIHDHSLRQFQMERTREMEIFNKLSEIRRQHGISTEPPRFNEYGHIINMPANVFSQPPPFLPQPDQQPIYSQPRYQIWEPSKIWTVGFTLSNNGSSIDQQIYELLQSNPLLPINASPSKIVFVYDVPEGHVVVQDNLSNLCYVKNTLQHRNQPVTPAISKPRVVQIDRETQTEFSEEERAKVATDNRETLHKANMESATKEPTITSNLSEPDGDEVRSAVCKVNNWFQVTDEIISNGSRSRSEEPLSDERSNSPKSDSNLPPADQTSSQPNRLHGSQSSGNFKKPAVPIVRHSDVESKKEAVEGDVVGDGDDNEKGRTAMKRDSEKVDDTNNVSLVVELSVAEKCSESDATETDINTLSHSHDDVNEKSQEGASIPSVPIQSKKESSK